MLSANLTGRGVCLSKQSKKTNQMNEQKFEYAKNRFITPSKIVDVSVYSKQASTPDGSGNYPTTWRVAISLDVSQTDKNVVYSDGFNSEAEAREFALKVPQ